MKLPHKKLADIVKVGTDRADPKDFPDMQYIGMADVESGTGKIINECFGREMKAISAQFKPGDVLYGRLRPYLNKVVRANSKGLASTEFIILRPTNGLNPSYLAWRLRANDFVNYANSLNTGDRPRVKFEQIASFDIEYPPLEIQDQTVDTIETQFTRLDAAIKSLKAVKAKLETYRQSILKAAFEGKLIENVSFKICTISDFCDKVQKIDPKKEKFGGFYYIDIGSIDNIRKRIIAPNIIHSNTAPSRARQETLPGDIVYSTVRVYLKNLAVVPELLDRKIISSTGFTVLRPNKGLNSRYLFYYLLSDSVTRMLNAKQRGTSYPAIRDNDVFDSSIPVPMTEVQERVVTEIDSRFSVIDKIEETVATALLKAERLRKSILKAAFEGRLVN